MLSVSVLLATTTVAVVVFALVRFIMFYMDVQRRAKHIMKFPGSDPHPLFGHIHLFPGPSEPGLEFMRDRVEESARVGKFYFSAFLPSISVFHADTVKAILRTSEPKPLSVGAYRFAYPWLGDGLLIAGGKKWARNRRLLTPAFHFDILKPYMKINNQCCEVFMDKVAKMTEKGESFETVNNISMLTLDVILRCAFSYDSKCQIEGESHPYVKAVMELGDSMVYRLLRPWLYPNWIFYMTKQGRQFKKNCDLVHDVSTDIIHKRQAALESGAEQVRKSQYLDFLDILLTAKDEDGQGLTEPEIRNEVDTFLFEGHDTTASGISWALYDMATNPEWQTKCQEEIDQILEGRDSDEILWDDLGQLKTLGMCIKESLRLHTPVPFIERLTTKDMTIDDFFLPAGTVVDIQLYVLHHNPHVWKEPMAFDPERFTPENIQKMDSFAFVPFSAGPRNCIGQNFAMHEMKTIMARILRRFRLELDPNRSVSHRIMVVMKTDHGMYMNAKPRSVARTTPTSADVDISMANGK